MSVVLGADNSAPATPAAAPAAPVTPAPEPAAAPTPAAGGARTQDALMALLNGADPASLGFSDSQVPIAPAAAPPGQAAPPGPTPAAPTGNEPRIPDKFRNPDGSVNTEALIASYSQMEGVFGRQGNEIGQLRQQLQTLQSAAAQPPAAPQAPTAPPEPAKPTLLDRLRNPAEKEAITEAIYEDPASFYSQLAQEIEDRVNASVEQRVQPLSPILEQHQQEQQINAFTQQVEQFTADGQHPDFQDLAPAIREIIQGLGDAVFNWPNPVEALYYMAKGRQAQNTPPAPAPAPPPTFEQMMADPANTALAKEKLKDQIISEHVQSVAKNAPPVVIGSLPGGVPPAAPAVKPRNAREASAMFLQQLGGS